MAMAAKTIGIAIDSWKLSIFTRHLRDAGYSFKPQRMTETTVLIRVVTDNADALGEVIKSANREASGDGHIFH